MAHITHEDLKAFAEDKVNLKKSEVDDQRAQVNRLRALIETKIVNTPGYGLVKTLHAGSVAKGTALRNVNDRDLAVYVRAEDAPDDAPGLVHWLHGLVVEAYPKLHADQIVANSRCVTVTFASSGLTVDVVPVLYDGAADDVGCLIPKNPAEPPVVTSVTQHLKFVRSRKKKYGKSFAQLIRFTKWWARQQKNRDSDFKCKSFMLELIWAHLADAGMALDDWSLALEEFFAFIAHGGLEQQIAFTDFASASNLPTRGTAPIEVLDPVNFDNNVASLYTTADRDRLVSAASTAYDLISTAAHEPSKTQALGLWQDILGTSFKAAA